MPNPSHVSAPVYFEADPDPSPSDPDSVKAEPSQPDPDPFNLNAILAISETALDEAEELDRYWINRNNLIGPLHGIPVIVKDSIATAGLTTTYGSVKAKGNVPEQDATIITKLKEAGAIILAKSTMPGRLL